MMKKLLAILLVLAMLAIGFCACADNEGTDDGSETQSTSAQTEDTSEDTGNNDNKNPSGDDGSKETVKEPEGTVSPDPEGDGYWTPIY